jgi:hypothetical protein
VEGSDTGDVRDSPRPESAVTDSHSEEDELIVIARQLVGQVLSQSLAKWQNDQVGEVWILCCN